MATDRETLAKGLSGGPDSGLGKGKPLSPDELMGSEVRAWSEFLGKDIFHTLPPQELLDVLKKAQEQGIAIFEPHYFPGLVIRPNTTYPGWKVRPNEQFWTSIKEGELNKDAAFVREGWILADGSQKPAYQDGQQMYQGDPFIQLLARLRKQKRLSQRDVPQGSRFHISHSEVSLDVLPEIAKLLGVKEEQVRLPRAIEFNLLGNLFHPEWGQTDTREWFGDEYGTDFPQKYLLGGGSKRGGLSESDPFFHYRHFHEVGFRPVIAFS